MGTKTNKALSSRVRITRKGKLEVSGKGRGHFNAKQTRSKQLGQKRKRVLLLPAKIRQRYLMSR